VRKKLRGAPRRLQLHFSGTGVAQKSSRCHTPVKQQSLYGFGPEQTKRGRSGDEAKQHVNEIAYQKRS